MICYWIHILLYFLIPAISSERCPAFFGEFECPMGYKCVDNQCSSENGQNPSLDCALTQCPTMTRCYKGKCYPVAGLLCNRNVLITNYTAKSVSSDCGQFGKCLNGRCVVDRCGNTTCAETDHCRDGICVRVSNAFCLMSLDCGADYECIRNSCTKEYGKVPCNCDPGESCQQGFCFPDPKCAHVTCLNGSFCSDGLCISAVGRDCSQETCLGGTVCIQGQCALDPCINRCPVHHACREGHCRYLQGLPCTNECPYPFECVDGRCTRNDCYHKACAFGEICENGLCVKVEGRLCNLAIRDCGQDFECESSMCKDKIFSNDEILRNRSYTTGRT